LHNLELFIIFITFITFIALLTISYFHHFELNGFCFKFPQITSNILLFSLHFSKNRHKTGFITSQNSFQFVFVLFIFVCIHIHTDIYNIDIYCTMYCTIYRHIQYRHILYNV
jgi:hypothetical protein